MYDTFEFAIFEKKRYCINETVCPGVRQQISSLLVYVCLDLRVKRRKLALMGGIHDEIIV